MPLNQTGTVFSQQATKSDSKRTVRKFGHLLIKIFGEEKIFLLRHHHRRCRCRCRCLRRRRRRRRHLNGTCSLVDLCDVGMQGIWQSGFFRLRPNPSKLIN